MDWGKQLRTFRERTNLKQEAAARMLGVSQASISRLESGVSTPTPELQDRLAKLLSRPEHRPILSYYRAMVANSPHHQFLLGNRNSKIFVEARSPSFLDLGAPFGKHPIGGALSGVLGSSAAKRLGLLIDLGVFSGQISCVETIWQYDREDGGVDYWRVTLVPIRDEHGRWYVFGTLALINEQASSALEAEWGGIISVKRHDEMIDPITVWVS